MCGIVGAIANNNVVPLLVEGLSRLEYRGYDSAGIAVINADGIRRVRAVGRVAEMQGRADSEGLTGNLGIGHTRWATHGGVTEFNAHPHVSGDDIAVVHNGIIENHDEQRNRLKQLGYAFESQTDTEVIAHLIHHYFQQSKDLYAATRQATAELTGAYAIAVVSPQMPDRLICARMGCPLLIGLGEGENYIASDVSALLSATRRVIYLEDGDSAELTREGITLLDRNGDRIARPVHVSDVSLASLELGPYSHFMQKEIHEQPRALTDSIEAVIDGNAFDVDLFGAAAAETFRDIDSILILAAGTSYYAGLTAKFWLESIA
ncbi:MAG TPA: isomerizing glutamine--fructose-6-phosphate transaminase, partial [Gallionella sp.]|nr:isomerizing glutamine--fructose-6-phosphate transaminase [Gallionella sp.]